MQTKIKFHSFNFFFKTNSELCGQTIWECTNTIKRIACKMCYRSCTFRPAGAHRNYKITGLQTGGNWKLNREWKKRPSSHFPCVSRKLHYHRNTMRNKKKTKENRVVGLEF